MIDLIAARKKNGTENDSVIVLQAPQWSGICVNDEVIDEDANSYIVLKKITTNENFDVFSFICFVSGSKLPLPKVMMKVEYQAQYIGFVYDDD